MALVYDNTRTAEAGRRLHRTGGSAGVCEYGTSGTARASGGALGPKSQGRWKTADKFAYAGRGGAVCVLRPAPALSARCSAAVAPVVERVRRRRAVGRCRA
jgi:hypothetical protein